MPLLYRVPHRRQPPFLRQSLPLSHQRRGQQSPPRQRRGPTVTATPTAIPTPMSTQSQIRPVVPLALQGIPPRLQPIKEPCSTEYPRFGEFPHFLSAIGARHFNLAPNANRINLQFVSAEHIGRVQVLGASGSLQPCDAVFVGNLELGDFVHTFADEVGAFEAEIDAVSGTHVLISRHPMWETPWGLHAPEGSAAVLIRLPVKEAPEGIAFSSAMRIQNLDDYAWVIRGSLGNDRMNPGQQTPISGQVILSLPSETVPPAAELTFGVFLIADEVGRQVGRGQDFASAFLTPTDLPIEMRYRNYRLNHDYALGVSSPRLEDGQRTLGS